MNFDDKFDNKQKEAIGWTEYLMLHLLQAKNNPNQLIVCQVPSEKSKRILEDALYHLIPQSEAAWQIEVQVGTVH